MVNNPNRSKRPGWTRDGDQWVFAGTLGTYRITEWCIATGSKFAIGFKPNSGGSKSIGESGLLQNAQVMAENYDGYRAS